MPRIVCSESMLADLNMLSYLSVHFFSLCIIELNDKCGFLVRGYAVASQSLCFLLLYVSELSLGWGKDSIGVCLYVYGEVYLYFFWKRVDVFYLKSYRKGHY